MLYVDDKLSKSFKSHLGEDAFYNFINSIIEESKFFTDMIKTHFNNELVMTKEDYEDFENSIKCWICDSVYVNGDVKVRDNVISLENIEVQHIKIVISLLNEIIKFLSYFTI